MQKEVSQVSNRERLRACVEVLELVATDEVISPTPYVHLLAAIHEVQQASRFVLDMGERDGVRS